MTCDLGRREHRHRERDGFPSLVVPMKTFARYLVLCALPVLFGAGAGYYFTTVQGSCGAMVGALFSGKCRGVQHEYQIRFQFGGAAAGILIAATLGTWLEHRRRRAVQETPSEGEQS
jgi:hypothetical protein